MKLETRFCKCGCGLFFRVLPSSKQKFANRLCQLFYEPKKGWRGNRDRPKKYDTADEVA